MNREAALPFYAYGKCAKNEPFSLRISKTIKAPSSFFPILVVCLNGSFDKSKNFAETHSGSSRTVNLEIAKDGIYHPLEV